MFWSCDTKKVVVYKAFNSFNDCESPACDVVEKHMNISRHPDTDGFYLA